MKRGRVTIGVSEDSYRERYTANFGNDQSSWIVVVRGPRVFNDVNDNGKTLMSRGSSKIAAGAGVRLGGGRHAS